MEDKKTATAINTERWEQQRNETIMHRRLEDFYKRWSPEDGAESHHFSVDLHMLVRSIYAEASEPANKQLMELMKHIPYVLPKVGA